MRRGGYQNPTTKRKTDYDEDPQMLYYAANPKVSKSFFAELSIKPSSNNLAPKAAPGMMHPHPGNPGVMMHSHSGPIDPYSVPMGYPCKS
jgi:hypothetical protein